MLKSIAVNIFLAALSKSAEAGARTFILAAMTGPEENGKYVKHYGSINVEYQLYVAFIGVNLCRSNSIQSTVSRQKT
jgi:hypothetical protein